ncbi:MAG: hypothetical protein ACRDTA_24350 [Pseudonocardiaceae bacterium]
MKTRPSAVRVGMSACLTIVVAYQPLILIVVSGLLVVSMAGVLIGVVLPAVWSRDPHRRKAAAQVLRLLLRAAS